MSIGQWVRFFVFGYFGALVTVGAVLWGISQVSPELGAETMGFFRWFHEKGSGVGSFDGAGFLKNAVFYFVYPVMWFDVEVLQETLGIPVGAALDYPGVREAHGIIVLTLSFVLWSTLYVRTANFIGLWNPFWNVRWRKRGIVLKSLSRLSEWWDRVKSFGRLHTGNFAPLMAVASHRFCQDDIFLGRPKLFIGGMMRPIGFKTEKHMVTIAGTGSGKSTAALIPNLCLHEGSLLCIDPKGELARITALRRGEGVSAFRNRGLGQDVFVLDPFRIVCERSACYNPFDEMARVGHDDTGRVVTYAEKIAEGLVKISERESYWDVAAKRLLMGLILYVFAFEEKKNLLRLRELIMRGDAEGYEEAVEAGVIKRKDLNSFDFLLEKMKLAKDDGPFGGAIANAAYSVLTMGDNQAGSIITTAQEHTSFLDNPEIADVCGESHFVLDDYKYKRQSVYLVMPINMMKGSAGGFLRMFILLFIDMMMRNEKPDNPPILLAIDEFPSLGRLEGIEVVAPLLRSYGVRFWAVGQGIEQFQETYPESWTGFIGNAAAMQFMGVTDPVSVDVVVRSLGTRTIHRKGGDFSYHLLDHEQVPRFLAKEHKNQIVWFGQQRPMGLKICPYFEYLPWWYYAADPRYPEKFRRRFWRFLFGRKE